MSEWPINEPPDYAILCDRTPDEMLAFADAHPGCFVLPFFTGTAAAMPDCSALNSTFIFKPRLIGNLPSVGYAIRQVVAVAFPTGNCIVDETPAE
jgi:hypothetical protein